MKTKIIKSILCLLFVSACHREVGKGESLVTEGENSQLFQIADIGKPQKVCELSNGTKIFRFEVGHVGSGVPSHWVYFSDKNDGITINQTIRQGKSSVNQTIVQIPTE